MIGETLETTPSPEENDQVLGEKTDTDIELENFKNHIRSVLEINSGNRKKAAEDIIENMIWPIVEAALRDKEKIEKMKEDLRKCGEINDREEFVSRVFSVVAPIFKVKAENPKEFEKIQRDISMERNIKDIGAIRLSEVLYCNQTEDGKKIRIHIAQAKTLGAKNKINSFIEGLKKLALIIKENENIERITGESWIIEQNPKLGKRFGFTIGPADEVGGKVNSVSISREDFLKLYL